MTTTIVKSFEGGVVVVDSGGGNEVDAEVYFPPGFEGVPLPGDSACTVASQDSASPAAVGFVDENTPEVTLGPGEVRMYSRAPDGTRTATVKLSTTGEVTIEAQKVTINAAVEANEFTIGILNLGSHTHLAPSGGGNTGGPLPGV